MKQPLPIGTSDFVQLRRAGKRYIDKTGLIVELLRASAQVILLPRPRRFGKTLGLSTLAAYLERPAPQPPGTATGDLPTTEPDRAELFQDLAVWQAGDDIRAHFQRYPVIFLTFKDIKMGSWPDLRAAVTRLITTLFERHDGLLMPVATTSELRDIRAIVDGTADNATLGASLALLSKLLHRATGERAVILIDEYDTPLHAAHHSGYYAEAIVLFRNLLSTALKDNPHLEKGVLTGILRVAKESVFSGLNNLSVSTILSRAYNQHFGFTPAEVALLAEEYGLKAQLLEIERWYNGYRFGGQVVYNPWSVLSYLSQPDDGFKPYWINTASDDLLRSLLVERGMISHGDLETLLAGGSVVHCIEEELVLRDLEHQSDAVWTLLLFAGYLRADGQDGVDTEGRPRWRLRIPNREVRQMYRGLFGRFLRHGLGRSERVLELCTALLRGDADTFGELLETLLLASLSHHDVAKSRGSGDEGDTAGDTAPDHRPEAVYQAFLLGLLVHMEASHRVTSNREAGRGRYDLLVSPRTPGEAGAVLELKVINKRRKETAETALASAMAQLRDRDYAAELREAGAGSVVQMGAVFDGKRVWVAVAEVPGHASTK